MVLMLAYYLPSWQFTCLPSSSPEIPFVSHKFGPLISEIMVQIISFCVLGADLTSLLLIKQCRFVPSKAIPCAINNTDQQPIGGFFLFIFPSHLQRLQIATLTTDLREKQRWLSYFFGERIQRKKANTRLILLPNRAGPKRKAMEIFSLAMGDSSNSIVGIQIGLKILFSVHFSPFLSFY